MCNSVIISNEKTFKENANLKKKKTGKKSRPFYSKHKNFQSEVPGSTLLTVCKQIYRSVLCISASETKA